MLQTCCLLIATKANLPKGRLSLPFFILKIVLIVFLTEVDFVIE